MPTEETESSLGNKLVNLEDLKAAMDSTGSNASGASIAKITMPFGSANGTKSFSVTKTLSQLSIEDIDLNNVIGFNVSVFAGEYGGAAFLTYCAGESFGDYITFTGDCSFRTGSANENTIAQIRCSLSFNGDNVTLGGSVINNISMYVGLVDNGVNLFLIHPTNADGNNSSDSTEITKDQIIQKLYSPLLKIPGEDHIWFNDDETTGFDFLSIVETYKSDDGFLYLTSLPTSGNKDVLLKNSIHAFMTSVTAGSGSSRFSNAYVTSKDDIGFDLIICVDTNNNAMKIIATI